MTERDYVIATNIVRVRLMKTLLREMNCELAAGVQKNEVTEIAVILDGWEKRCETAMGR